MNSTEKNANIDSLKTRLASAQSLVLADFRGLTVESDNKLRREFRAVGCEYQVVKNTLLGKADQEMYLRRALRRGGGARPRPSTQQREQHTGDAGG